MSIKWEYSNLPMLSLLIDGWQVALLTLTSAYMEGKDVINVEIQIIGHRHYKASDIFGFLPRI